MPTYEYFCEACQKEFETILTIHEHEEGKIVCPKCGSEKVQHAPTPFVAKTSRKS